MFRAQLVAMCKVKWDNLDRTWIFVPAAQQDCAGGLEHSWCRSCTYANSEPANIPGFAVVP